VGVLAAVAANVSFAAGVVLTRRLPAPAPAHRLAATGWQLLLGGVLLIPLALAAEGRPPALTGPNVVGFAYLSLVGTALAFLLWFEGIRRLPAAAPPLLGLAAPVTGALLGWMILRQSLSPVQLAGFVLTLGAIAYGAVLGASAKVSDQLLREQPDRVAHPVGDDQCAAAPRADDDGLVSSLPKEVDRPKTAPSAGNISSSAVSCSRGRAAPVRGPSGCRGGDEVRHATSESEVGPGFRSHLYETGCGAKSGATASPSRASTVSLRAVALATSSSSMAGARSTAVTRWPRDAAARAT
jgi:probable blue pigment (indigoidine) exporter